MLHSIGNYNTRLICNGSGKHDFVHRDQVEELENPEVMGPRHHPISFHTYLSLIEDELLHHDWAIEQHAICMDKEGKSFFSAYQVVHRWDESDQDFAPTIIAAGSHDQTLPRRLNMGTFTFVCTNKIVVADLLALKTKQTTNIEDRLGDMVEEAIAKLAYEWDWVVRRYDHMKKTGVPRQQAHDIFVNLHRSKLLSSKQLAAVIAEYHDPRALPEEYDGSMWAVYSAVTAVLDGLSNPHTSAYRTSMIDKFFRGL